MAAHPSESQPAQPVNTDSGNTDHVKPHSIYTTTQKKVIVLAVSIAALFSPMTANIYIPALNTLAADYHVSISLINLTVTTYLIFQGLAPTFVGGFSDDAGRRPAYIICFVIYLAANIGLSVQNSYPALLILRMVQSAGSSGTVALSNAVVADLITSAERGTYIGYASVPGILGPAVSPIFGGLLSQFCGWRWIFRFLVIFSAAFFIPLILFLPETCRKIVGDGSIPPPPLNHSPLTFFKEKKYRKHAAIQQEGVPERPTAMKPKLRFPNPLIVLRLIFNKLSGIILVSSGLLFCCYYVVTVSIATEFKRVYNYNDLEISLMFLPFGAGSLISSIVTGPIINWNYRRHAIRNNFPIERNKQYDLTNFPIERARLEVSIPLLCLAALAVVGYGWLLEAKTHVAGPCVMLFIIGYAMIAGFNGLSILMVDVYPGRPASATAANNLLRCLLGAASTAVLSPLIKAIGVGWSATLFAAIWAATIPFLFYLMKKGPEWRKEAKERSKEEERQKTSMKADVEAATGMGEKTESENKNESTAARETSQDGAASVDAKKESDSNP